MSEVASPARPTSVATWSSLPDREPQYALVANVDLVVVRFGDAVSVLYGRCLHRGALLADGFVQGDNLVCGVHNWDYRYDTGVSEYNPSEVLHKFTSWIDADADSVLVDEAEIEAWHVTQPQPFDRDAYQGLYADPSGTPDEPHVGHIQKLAKEGLSKVGHHGPTSAMGVSRRELPQWDDIQIVTAQMWKKPLLDDEPVATALTIGPEAKKPLTLEIPIFVSDMSFGALSEEAKVALARGAELAGTGICSGEGGMLPDEKAENSRYFYELASAKFGWALEKAASCQAFHFKGGQGAKTGTGGHLPGNKVIGKIAEVRGLEPGTPAISPARFLDLDTPPTTAALRMKCGKRVAGSRSASSSPPSTSSATSTSPSKWASSTSSSTGAAAGPVPRRTSSSRTSRSRRWQRSPGRAGTSIAVDAATSL